jgi:hypothetical protein
MASGVKLAVAVVTEVGVAVLHAGRSVTLY